jgi:hypothetical protein
MGAAPYCGTAELRAWKGAAVLLRFCSDGCGLMPKGHPEHDGGTAGLGLSSTGFRVCGKL